MAFSLPSEASNCRIQFYSAPLEIEKKKEEEK
jgi:hypothetical protein